MMRYSTVLCIATLAEALGDVKVQPDELDRSMFGGVLPGVFISSEGPNIDFVTFAEDRYSLQRHAVKQCKPCPGVGLDVCKLKRDVESGFPCSGSKWSHLFEVVTKEQHLALVVSEEKFACEKHWPLRYDSQNRYAVSTVNDSACVEHPVAEFSCIQCLNELGGRLQNPCSKCSYFGFDCSCVLDCGAASVPKKTLVLANGCFGYDGAHITNRSTALYSYNFGNFRREMSFMTAVDPSLASHYDMYFFTDYRSISGLMQLISQRWTVCPVELSLLGDILEPGNNGEINYRTVAKWFKFGHVPSVLQSYQYLIHADCSKFGANHNYYRIPLPDELNSLVTTHPLVSFFGSSQPPQTSAVQDLIAAVENSFEQSDSAAKWLAHLRRDPYFYSTLDNVAVFHSGLFIRRLKGEKAQDIENAFVQLYRTMHQFGLYRDHFVLPFILLKFSGIGGSMATMCAFDASEGLAINNNCNDLKWSQPSSVALTKGRETPRLCTNPGWNNPPSFLSYSGVEGLPLSRETNDEQSRIANLGCNLQNTENPASVYMSKYIKRLQDLKQHECSELVVYGAAFGAAYVEMMDIPKSKRNRAISKKLLRVHGSCFFTFIKDEFDDNSVRTKATAGNILKNFERAKDGLNILLPVNTSALNFANMRRGTKLFKFFGHKIFPWATRILWQDAKLGVGRKFPLNVNLNIYFEKTVQRNDVCVAFMGLPVVDATMGVRSRRLKGADFNRHCTAIVNSGRKDVTDDRKGLLRQCLSYQENVLLKDGGNISLDLSRKLIDTALIAWDFRKDRCRDFADKLYCFWAHEVHCFSDRDQISFPYALYQMGLQEQAATGIGHNSDDFPMNHITWVNTNRQPLVHIVDSSCHWYQHYSIDKCLDGVLAAGSKRVAVMVAGSFNRYFLKSSAVHLIKPLTKQGYNVDYFLSLTTESARAYRSELGYTSFSTFDPAIGPVGHGGAHTSISVSLRLRKVLGHAGANLREFKIQYQISVDSDARLKSRHRMAKRENPSEDPDLRFPTRDMSAGAAHAQNAVANRNLLRLHLAMERLWHALLRAEAEDGVLYDYVLFLRDDIKWLANFDMDRLIAQGPADVFVLACDARKPPLHPDEINDHGLVASRDVADVFGLYLSRLLDYDVDDCQKQMTQPMGERGCNSEMLLKWVIEKENLVVKRVGQNLIPFQRSMHLNLNGRIVECFHKYCKSTKDNLDDFGIQQCKTIKTTNTSVKLMLRIA